jgi:RimJ/RimL family protein N-acetyltransferase
MEDAEAFTRWENDLAVALPLGDEAFVPVSLEKSHEQVGEAIRNQSHVFAIVDISSDRLIGRCMLFSLDLVNRTAMLGMMIGEKEYWDHGYGQEASRLLLDYGFNLLNLNSIMLGVYAFNERAIQAYRRVGFREIGRRRQARIINGQKFDMVEMDILAEEFTPLYVKQFLPK